MKPSTTIDTFPSKIYTIMACGKPVIVQADPNSELEWLIKEVGCGYVVPPGNSKAFTEALQTAYQERDLLCAKGLRGLELVRTKYSKEIIGLQYDRLVYELIGKNGSL
jgi:glycosyltransferase involved in cell wall biosynthesis